VLKGCKHWPLGNPPLSPPRLHLHAICLPYALNVGTCSCTDPKSDIRRCYLHSFFSGYTNPNGTMTGGDPADFAGFQAGQEYRRAHPTELKQTMEGFGYTTTNAHGSWRVFFEHSVFRPQNEAGRGWWLTPLPDPETNEPPDQHVPADGRVVRISGFLSPEGRYGHLGICDREFFATNVSVVPTGQPNGPANGSQPVRSGTNSTSSAAGSRR